MARGLFVLTGLLSYQYARMSVRLGESSQLQRVGVTEVLSQSRQMNREVEAQDGLNKFLKKSWSLPKGGLGTGGYDGMMQEAFSARVASNYRDMVGSPLAPPRAQRSSERDFLSVLD